MNSIIIFITLSACKLADSLSIFNGVKLIKVKDLATVDLGTFLDENKLENQLVILGTYAADFNAIEYAQRIRHYLPALTAKGITKQSIIFNASPDSIKSLAKLVDLPEEIELLSDEEGHAGKAFGVSLGFLPEEKEVSPYIKLFAMLFGLGAYATLPGVISGYIGNPFAKQPWIETSLQQGQLAGRWPNTALELDSQGNIIKNKFSELPYVGNWGRRPLELATLRLQNMIGISLQNLKDLKPSEKALDNGVLTQLGGLFILGKDGQMKYEWRDAGICHVANFENILKLKL